MTNRLSQRLVNSLFDFLFFRTAVSRLDAVNRLYVLLFTVLGLVGWGFHSANCLVYAGFVFGAYSANVLASAFLARLSNRPHIGFDAAGKRFFEYVAATRDAEIGDVGRDQSKSICELHWTRFIDSLPDDEAL